MEEEISEPSEPPPRPQPPANFLEIQMASFQIDFELSSASGFWQNGRKREGVLRRCNGGNGSKVKRYEDEMAGKRAAEGRREERERGGGRAR